tara:strand:- start:235 stop:405 length:171 start_codon:yes stop_codon:yes gene_type:complete
MAGVIHEYDALIKTRNNDIPVLFTVPLRVIEPSDAIENCFLNVDDCSAGFPDLKAK